MLGKIWLVTEAGKGGGVRKIGRQGGMRRRTDEGRREESKGKKYRIGEGEAETETQRHWEERGRESEMNGRTEDRKR